MAEQEADRCDVDEAQETYGGLVVTGGDAAGILELVEAPFVEVPQLVERAVDGHAQLAEFPYRDHRHHVPRLHGFANIVRVIATIRQQDGGLGQVVVHDQIEAQIVRYLARRVV